MIVQSVIYTVIQWLQSPCALFLNDILFFLFQIDAIKERMEKIYMNLPRKPNSFQDFKRNFMCTKGQEQSTTVSAGFRKIPHKETK